MFERYTESARRVLFFARWEASQLGHRSIETEHLLLGMVRQRKGIVDRLLADRDLTYDTVLTAVRSRTVIQERFPTEVEIPFSEQVKSVLYAAMHEADGLTHSYIGTEHLFLGLLHESQSVGGSILQARGFNLDETRTRVIALLNEPPVVSGLAAEVDEILKLVDDIELTAIGGPQRTLTPNVRAIRSIGLSPSRTSKGFPLRSHIRIIDR